MSAPPCLPSPGVADRSVLDVLSAALDSGVAVSTIIIFFTLQYPAKGTIGLNTIQAWWGNTVALNTADGNKLPLWQAPENGTFG